MITGNSSGGKKYWLFSGVIFPLLTNTFPKPQLLSCWYIPPLRASPDKTWGQILFHICCSWKAVEENGVVDKMETYFLTFAAAWVWRWALRFDLSENDFSQMGHPYGFSPVCVRMCPFNSHGREKIFPHWRQRWPEPCVRRCMEYAGMETYTWNIKLSIKITPLNSLTLLHSGHFLALLSSGERCVCLEYQINII